MTEPGKSSSDVPPGRSANQRYRIATRCRDALLLGAAAAAIYFVFRQYTWYRFDGYTLLHRTLLGWDDHPYQAFYVVLLEGAIDIASWLGTTPYEAALALSVAAGGVSVALAHFVAPALGFARRASWFVTATFATTPAFFFFATIVEVHSVFMMFAAFCLLTLAVYVRRPGPTTAVLAALGCTLAFLAHPSGGLIGSLLPALWWIGRHATGAVAPSRSFARAMLGFAGIGVLLGIAVVLLPRWMPYLGFPATNFAHIESMLGSVKSYDGTDTGERSDSPFAVAVAFGRLFATEWLLPLAPSSLLAVLAAILAPRRAGPALCWLVASTFCFVAGSWLILDSISEYGAYFLPLIVPNAMLAVIAVRHMRWLAIAGPLLGLAAALSWLAAFDDSERIRRLARDMRAAAGDADFAIFCGHEDDFRAAMMYELRTRKDVYERLFNIVLLLDKPAALATRYAPQFDDRCFLISAPTLERLREAVEADDGFVLIEYPRMTLPKIEELPLLLHLIEDIFVLEPVSVGEFEGYRLRVRSG